MTEIGPKRFRLLFRGQLSQGASEGAARDALMRELGLKPEQLDACFSGRKVALRSNLDEQAARQLMRVLGDAGLQVSSDPALPAAASETPVARAPATEPAAAPAAAPTPKPAPTPASTQCPRCQARSADGGLCRTCRAARRRTAVRWSAGLVAVAAVASLAGWAWLAHLQPWLHEYQSRKHLNHAVTRVTEAQQAIIALYEKTGFLPNTNLDANLPAADAFADEVVAGIRVGSSAQITLSLQPSLPLIGGKTLIFVPERHDKKVIDWRCEAGTLDAQRRPQSCRHKLVIARPSHKPTVGLDDLEQIASKVPIASSDPLARRKSVALDEINDIIGDSKSLRLKMMTYFATSAEWPASNDYLGLPPPNRLGGGNIQSVKVLPDGRIEYRFNSRTTGLEGHRFWLKAAGMGQWRCATTLPDDHLPPACDSPIL